MQRIFLIIAILLMVSFNSYAEMSCPEPGTPGWITNGSSTYVINNGHTVGVGMAYYDGENDYVAEGQALDNSKLELSNRLFDVTYSTLKSSFTAMSMKDRVKLAREITNNMVSSIEWKGLTHEMHIVNCNDLYVKIELPMDKYAFQLEGYIETAVSNFNGNKFDCWEQERIAFELKKNLYLDECVVS